MDMLQSRFGKIDEFGWWELEKFSADAGSQFTSMNFKGEFQTFRVHMTLEAPEHQEIKGQVKVKWRTLCTVEH